jgi:hypothetical protein
VVNRLGGVAAVGATGQLSAVAVPTAIEACGDLVCGQRWSGCLQAPIGLEGKLYVPAALQRARAKDAARRRLCARRSSLTERPKVEEIALREQDVGVSPHTRWYGAGAAGAHRAVAPT